jgi:signal recognition particle subunit SRP54
VLARIREKAVGVEVSKALDPAQQVVKIVHAELIGLLGGETLKVTCVRAAVGNAGGRR